MKERWALQLHFPKDFQSVIEVQTALCFIGKQRLNWGPYSFKRPFCSKQALAVKLLLSKKISSERFFRVGWDSFMEKKRGNCWNAADCIWLFFLLSFQNQMKNGTLQWQKKMCSEKLPTSCTCSFVITWSQLFYGTLYIQSSLLFLSDKMRGGKKNPQKNPIYLFTSQFYLRLGFFFKAPAFMSLIRCLIREKALLTNPGYKAAPSEEHMTSSAGLLHHMNSDSSAHPK